MRTICNDAFLWPTHLIHLCVCLRCAGDLKAAIKAVEAVDVALGRVERAVSEKKGEVLSYLRIHTSSDVLQDVCSSLLTTGMLR